MSYDFSTLNDKDLEELARDILSVKMSIDFQSFKMGADKGIDLRYATNNNENEIIVQVKHYLGSGISKLKEDLKKKEAHKVKTLNPTRYIFVTSLPLSVKNKEEIKIIFNPFILSTNDILGKNELNNFLRNNSDIVNAHFKLWLSSTNVLKRILHNGIKGRSEFFDKRIKYKIKIFVPSKTHNASVEILNKYNFILITGAPGIGKSTLANMLTYQLLAEDFELIYVREIKEAEDLYTPNKKQVFYFDDFLGSITLDLTSSRNADSAIVQFIDRIKSDKTKRLILTCRTMILNQAKEASEKINNSKVEISNYEVKIDDYRDIDKARILYNHVYFSNLSEELKTVFFKDQFYWKVIKHRHYNPRIVEFFTDVERLQPDIEYSKEVMNFLEDPSSIWEKPYTIQTSDNAKLFLSTLYSLGGKYVISEDKVKETFEARINYEVLNNNYERKGNVFTKVINELTGGFIVRTIKTNNNHNQIEYRFLNPSIEDFFYVFFSKNMDEYFNILKSSVYFEQFKRRITTKEEPNYKRIYFAGKDYEKLLEIFIDKLPNLKSSSVIKDLDAVAVLIKLFQWKDIQEKVITIMNRLDIGYLGWDDRENLIDVLDYLAENKLLDLFTFSIEDMFLKLAEETPSHFQIEALSKLILKHKVYSELIETNKTSETEYYARLQDNIDKSWKSGFDYFITNTNSIDEIVDKEDLIETINRRIEEANKLNSYLNISSPFINQYIFDYDAQLERNIAKASEQAIQIGNLKTDNDSIDEPLEINRLFNSEGIPLKLNPPEWDDLPF